MVTDVNLGIEVELSGIEVELLGFMSSHSQKVNFLEKKLFSQWKNPHQVCLQRKNGFPEGRNDSSGLVGMWKFFCEFHCQQLRKRNNICLCLLPSHSSTLSYAHKVQTGKKQSNTMLRSMYIVYKICIIFVFCAPKQPRFFLHILSQLSNTIKFFFIKCLERSAEISKFNV